MKNKILLAVSILFGLMMIVFGFNKFAHLIETPALPENAMNLMIAFGKSGWIIPLLAIVEMIGGALVLLPKTRALGAIVLFPVIVGIFLFHAVLDPSGMAISVVLLLINVFIIFENKDKYMHMIS